jgi:primary-amine oxidase
MRTSLRATFQIRVLPMMVYFIDLGRNRSIDDTDVVLWYAFGHAHIPRPEDYPLMPATYIGFLLKPNGFLIGIPPIDVPPSTPKDHASSKGTCAHY